jgi:hypothetical protein
MARRGEEYELQVVVARQVSAKAVDVRTGGWNSAIASHRAGYYVITSFGSTTDCGVRLTQLTSGLLDVADGSLRGGSA